jgi:hypothetical protein
MESTVSELEGISVRVKSSDSQAVSRSPDRSSNKRARMVRRPGVNGLFWSVDRGS